MSQASPPKQVGLILAAGQSRRMGAENKLLRQWNGKPLVRHVFDAAVTSKLDEVIVVSGHEEQALVEVLPEAQTVHNGRFEEGMGTSVAEGVSAICNRYAPAAIMILLGDMPFIQTSHINSFLTAFDGKAQSIVCATSDGKRGNPVLFGAGWFDALTTLEGDEGARSIVRHSKYVTEVEIGPASRIDFDTPAAFTDGPWKTR